MTPRYARPGHKSNGVVLGLKGRFRFTALWAVIQLGRPCFENFEPDIRLNSKFCTNIMSAKERT